MKVVDLSGQTLGGLYVIRKDVETTTIKQRAHYICRCNHCGCEKVINSGVFRKKPPVSCGCRKASGHTHPKSRPDKGWEKRLYWYARRNAKRRGEECSLVLDDIVIPEICPVLGIRLQPGSHSHQDCSPSVDRIDSTKGYTKDNVWIISARANRIKNNATIEEIKLLYEALVSLCKN